MKLLLKVLFFVIATFQINIGDSNIFLVDKAISEVAHSNIFNSEEDSVQYENVFLENDLLNTCKREIDVGCERNFLSSSKSAAAKGKGRIFNPDRSDI